MWENESESTEIVENVYEDKGEFEYSFVAKSDKGYYFWEPLTVKVGTSRLLFMDANSRKVVPLCNKPDCEHDTKECNAYYPAIGEAEYGLDKSYIQYYNGNLYALGCDEENYVSLFRIKADGTEWEKVQRLYRTDYVVSREWTTPFALLKNDYVFYANEEQTNQKLQCKSLDGKEEKIIFEDEYDKAFVYRLKEYGDCIYFQSYHYTDETMESFEGALYRCDKEGNVEFIKEGLIVPYSVCGNQVYYGSNGKLCCYSLEDKTEHTFEIVAKGIVDVSSTKDYIIVDDYKEKITYFYNKSGELLYTVGRSKQQISCCGGDSKFRFGQGEVNEEDSGWYILEIEELENEASWKKL